jgi:hypothetical protein
MVTVSADGLQLSRAHPGFVSSAAKPGKIML